MPRVPMTWTTKFALYFLRVYLLVMLALILYKFIKIVTSGQMNP